MDFPLWLWAIPAGSFAVLEAIAIRNRRQGDTASQLLRWLAGIKPVRPWGTDGMLWAVEMRPRSSEGPVWKRGGSRVKMPTPTFSSGC